MDQARSASDQCLRVRAGTSTPAVTVRPASARTAAWPANQRTGGSTADPGATAGDDRRLPPALADLATMEFGYDEGHGIDFEPYAAFDSAEESTEWLRSWTGNDDFDGGAYRVFAVREPLAAVGAPTR